MTMKLRKIVPVVGLIAVALVGLIILQVSLLENAFLLKEQAFRQNVRTALGTAALKVQAGETLSRVVHSGLASGSRPAPDGNNGTPPSRGTRVSGTSVSYNLRSKGRPMIRIRLFRGGAGDTLQTDSLRESGDGPEKSAAVSGEKGGYLYDFFSDSVSTIVRTGTTSPGETVRTGPVDRDRLFVVSTVYDDLLSEGGGIEKKINPVLLDSVLKVSMHEAGIPLPYAYGILSPRRDSVLMANPAGASQDLRATEFHVPLFHLAFGPPQGELAVYFSGREAYLFGQIWPALTASILFIAIIALCFAYTGRTIMRQQRLAAGMVEFINNMTHEFKTPIATITLASEAIRRPDVIRSSSRVGRYNGMIAEETLRMKNQVDRILQMAVVEEGDYELSLTDVDMHTVIRTAVGSAALGVESRGGSITSVLGAERRTIRGDAVHLANIVHNILDNASKYSPGAPIITVSTADDGPWLVVRVIDRGIGIPPEHIHRVFDKYYRVPTGNLHEVKGFGLGLSYVRLLVEAHGGTIALKSRPEEGTEVEMRFPEAGPR
jgi:two-component system phosphate regulon sensor histidine kinase PhoR